MGCIYKITCIPSGKSYIGKDKYGNRRVNHHLKGNSKECPYLYNAMKKYGIENFTVEILHEGIIPELLADFEITAIKEHNTKAPQGYNLTDGGEGSLNPSEETIEKRRQKMLGREVSKETRNKIGRSHLGIRPNSETKAKQSAAKKGKPSPMKDKKHAPESKLKMSASHKGKTIPKETCEKISDTLKGIQRTPYTAEAKKFFLSLSDSLLLSEKSKLLREKYPDVSTTTRCTWIKQWSNIASIDTRRSEYYDAEKLYFSLPKDMRILEKRKNLFSRFTDVPNSTIREWIRKWSGITTTPGTPVHPKYTDVHQYFLSLPPEMSLENKRSQCYAKFPNVRLSTIYQWVQKWSPDNDAHKKKERREKARSLILSMPNNLDFKEKQEILRKQLPEASYESIRRWTRKWQSEL